MPRLQKHDYFCQYSLIIFLLQTIYVFGGLQKKKEKELPISFKQIWEKRNQLHNSYSPWNHDFRWKRM